MKKKVLSIFLTLVLVCSFSLVTAVPVAAEPDGTVKIAQIIHNLTTEPSYADEEALFNWLADYDTDVTQIKIGDMEGKSIDYWEQFDLIILTVMSSSLSIANLLASGVPIISVEVGFADELELGTGEQTFKENTRDFYVKDNTHPITSGLTLDKWTWSGTGTMWTRGTNNAGYTEATVLVDSGVVGEDILIVHETKKYAFFGWYQPNQWPAEGWDLMEKTIGWAIGRPLPPFSLEFTVEITDPDTAYKPGDTINIAINTSTAGYTVTGDFSDLAPVTKMAGIAYKADTWIVWNPGGFWQHLDVEYWMDTYLGSLGYMVEKIAQQIVDDYTGWEAYDVVFISEGFASSHDLTNLFDSGVPIIMTGQTAAYVQQAGLGDGTYEKDNMQTFYVVDNTHPITQGLPIGEWSFAESMWTTRIGTSGGVTVLIDDNASPANAYLATRQEPNRVWFGYYRGTEAGAEARGIFRNSVAWALGKDSLPSLKADATDNGNGTYSMSYTIGDAPLVGTFTIPITAEDQVGHIATNDSLSVTVGNTAVWMTAQLEEITAINVEPSSIDFGTITPGTPVSGDNINVTNIGTVTIDVKASLQSPGTVFKYLELDNVSPISDWRIEDLAGGDTADAVKTLLEVPRDYSAKGEETNTLIFTARTY